MKIVSKYKVYRVLDSYKYPKRVFLEEVYSKQKAEEMAREITQKGLDIMGRINYWGEMEWAGFAIV